MHMEDHHIRLGQELGNHLACHVCEPVRPALEFEGQALVVDAEQVQERGVEVVDVDRVFDDRVAEVVGAAEGDAALDAAAGQPDAEGVLVMVAAGLGGRLVVSSVPCIIGVRPNSPPQTTSVSSSRPRCFRSCTSAAIG